MRVTMMNYPLLQEVSAFVATEADMLDHREYADWLGLWKEDGLYIVPIDPLEQDYDNTLNYARDDHEIRQLRVARLTGGESVSTKPPPRTIRQISRERILSQHDGLITLRCAMFLSEFRKDVVRYCSADIEYQLVKSGDSFKLYRKIVRLINSDDAQVTVGFIF